MKDSVLAKADVYLNGRRVPNPRWIRGSLPAEPAPELNGALACRGSVTTDEPFDGAELTYFSVTSSDSPKTYVYSGWVQIVPKGAVFDPFAPPAR